MNDREVQNEVIRYLADANVRAQAPCGAPVPAGEAAQFAHFLARRYYRDRLARSFRYSHRFRRQTGRMAEEVVDSEEFDRFLSECVIGSLDSAQRVGEMARARLGVAPQPGPWWPELLDYEYAYFLQAATSEPSPAPDHPARGVSAVCRRFTWELPQLLPRLRADAAIGDELRREATLLFSRTREGRIYVVEVEPQLEDVFLAVDGSRTPEQIARAARVAVAQALQALVVLNSIGAVVMVGAKH